MNSRRKPKKTDDDEKVNFQGQKETENHDIQTQLQHLRKIIQAARFEEALDILSSIKEQKEQCLTSDRITWAEWHVLCSLSLMRQGQTRQGLSMAKKALQILTNENEMDERCKDTNNRITKSFPRQVPSMNENATTVMVEAVLAACEALERLGNLNELMTMLGHARESINHVMSSRRPLLKSRLHYLQGIAAYRCGNFDEALDILTAGINIIHEIPDEQSKKTSKADFLRIIGSAYHAKGELDKALECFQQSLELKKQVGNKQDIAIALNNIGLIYHEKGNQDRALEYLQQSLELKKQVGNKQDIATALTNIGIIYREKGNLTRALEYFQEYLIIVKQIGNKQDIAIALNNIGSVYREKGELDKALECFQQSLELKKQMKNDEKTAVSLLQIGITYREKGDYKNAIHFLKQSLTKRKQNDHPVRVSESLYQLIITLLEDNNTKEARNYFEELKNYHKNGDNPIIHQQYRLCQAMLLKNGQRLRDLLEAQRIFEELAHEEVVSHELTITALLEYCRLLLHEHRLTKLEEVLLQTRKNLEKLLNIAKQQHSHSLVARTYWLLAKVSLVEGNISKAQQLLLQAQMTAEEMGLNPLAAQISEDHDDLILQPDTWKSEVVNTTSLSERIRRAKLDTLIQRITHSQVIASFQSKDIEEPTWMLIVTEDGLLLFSKQFSPKVQGTAELLSGLLNSVHLFSQEIFSQKLDRMKIGEYTVVMIPDSPLLLAYACKGSSFRARQRLFQFKNLLHEKSDVHQQLLQAATLNQQLDSETSHLIEELVNSLFSGDDDP